MNCSCRAVENCDDGAPNPLGIILFRAIEKTGEQSQSGLRRGTGRLGGTFWRDVPLVRCDEQGSQPEQCGGEHDDGKPLQDNHRYFLFVLSGLRFMLRLALLSGGGQSFELFLAHGLGHFPGCSTELTF